MIQSRVFAKNYTHLERIGVSREVFDREVLLELTKLHLDMLVIMPWVQIFLVLGIGLFVYKWVPPSIFIAWGLISCLVEVLRALYARSIMRLPQLQNLQEIKRRITILSVLSGAILGFGAAVFVKSLPLPEQALLGIVIFVIPGAQFPATAIQILFHYIILVLVPISYQWVSIFPQLTIPVISLVVLYMAFVFIMALGREGLIRTSMIIRFEHRRTVRDLELRNKEVLKAIQKAEQSALARGRVLAAASHDLRQPLHALSVYSAILLSNPESETIKEVAANIDRLVRVLGGLMHGLLDLSRLSSDMYLPERQRISLDRLAADICREFESHAQAKQIKLITDLAHVRLYDDKIGIARIIRNLLDNAIKYTDQGEVRIVTAQSGDSALLMISDTGRGIPEEEQNRIFEEFYQLDNPGRDLGKGIGLGLTIVHRLCEVLGVKMTLVSEAGKGTCFNLLFRSVMLANTHLPQNTKRAANILEGKQVYIIDDEIDILESTSRLLKTWSMQVKTANSIAATEQLFKQFGAPELLIVDLQIGEKEHGFEMAKRLQSLYGEFPILVITGETSSIALQQAKSDKNQVLQKPIAADVLFEEICAALKLE